MLNLIQQLDSLILFAINGFPHWQFLNIFFLFFSFDPLIVWLVIGVMVVIYEERKDKLFLVKLFLSMLLARA